jgi:hypothetical protein
MPAYARSPRVIEREKLDFLAGLYDLAAHSLDPLSEESAKAEDQFYSEVARLFDDLPEPKPELKAFQKKIIQACRAKLIHGDKPTGI